jgi:hypothetical protein
MDNKIRTVDRLYDAIALCTGTLDKRSAHKIHVIFAYWGPSILLPTRNLVTFLLVANTRTLRISSQLYVGYVDYTGSLQRLCYERCKQYR